MPEASHASKSSSLGEESASNAALFSSRRRSIIKNIARFSSRDVLSHSLTARLIIRNPSDNQAGVLHRFNAAVRRETANASAARSFVRKRWDIYARNTETEALVFLGTVDGEDEPKTLADAPLPDGTWEIEARPSDLLWEGCRTRKIVTVIAGTPLEFSLPAIVNLEAEVAEAESVLTWNVSDEQSPVTFTFGLWFSATTPVDVSGDPDFTVAWVEGEGPYFFTREQEAPEYVAVASFFDIESGPISEIFLPWGGVISPSPPNQFGYGKDPG